MKKLILIPFVTLITLLVVFALFTKPAPNPESKPPESAPPTTNSPPLTTLFFAGDIMLSRNVEDRMAQAGDYALPFRQVADAIKAADIAFANLESPFHDQGRHYIPNSLVFNANPKSVEGLNFAGFDVLATANNHSFDQSQKGLAYTLDWLASHGIKSVGTAKPDEPLRPAVIKKNDLLFGFLAYSYTAHNDGGQSTSPQIGNFQDLAGLKQDIISLKGHNADIVIVSMHAGTEYTRTPSQAQVDFAHAAIEAGADMVIGHHPHWIQTTEIYQGKPIFYSLGNFVFDQMWSEDTKEGLTALVTYENSTIKKVELKPVVIENYCCARWADPAKTETILRKIHLTDSVLMDKND